MLNKLKNKVNSPTRRRLVKNFFSLSSIQIVSYILPLITIPYLARVLGIEKFGLIAFAQAVIQYFVIFTDYGFGLSATKQISEDRENKKRIAEIFSSIIIIKIIMLLLSISILSIFIFSFEKFQDEWILYYLTFGVVIGQAIFPVWYFQGIEKMHITALVNIVPKIIFTISIFIFVSNEEDYLYVPLINSLGFMVAGVVSLWLAIRHYKVSFVLPKYRHIRYQIQEGWHIFLGTVSSSFSMLNVTFFLGVLTNPVMVGYYAAVEKIIRPLASLNRPVINAIFPHLSSTVKVDPQKAYKLSKKVSFALSGIMFFIGIVLFLFSNTIINFVFGGQFHESSIVLKIMAFIPMFNALIHMYGITNMILHGFKKVYSKILFLAFFFSIFSSYTLIMLFNVEGAAASAVLTDIIILIAMGLYLKKNLKII